MSPGLGTLAQAFAVPTLSLPFWPRAGLKSWRGSQPRSRNSPSSLWALECRRGRWLSGLAGPVPSECAEAVSPAEASCKDTFPGAQWALGEGVGGDDTPPPAGRSWRVSSRSSLWIWHHSPRPPLSLGILSRTLLCDPAKHLAFSEPEPQVPS